MSRWGLHVCALDSHCRRWAGPVWRIELSTPWWHAGLAVLPGSRYVGTGDGSYWTSFRRKSA